MHSKALLIFLVMSGSASVVASDACEEDEDGSCAQHRDEIKDDNSAMQTFSRLAKADKSKSTQSTMTEAEKVVKQEAEAQLSILSDPFSQYPGCETLITSCSPNDEQPLWNDGTWQDWVMGFETCCLMAGHSNSTCSGLKGEVFDIVGNTVNADDKVKDAGQDLLSSFCPEVGVMVEAHNLHLKVGLMKAAAASLFQSSSAVHERMENVVQHLNGCMAEVACKTSLSQRVHDHITDMIAPRNPNVCPGKSGKAREACIFCGGIYSTEYKGVKTSGQYNCQHTPVPGDICPKDWRSCECNWFCSSYQCFCESSFPSDAKVTLASGRDAQIADLQSGDRVISPSIADLTTVTAEHMIEMHATDDGHDTVLLEYVELTHKNMPNRPLRITSNHLLFVMKGADGSWALAPASSVQVGDWLLALNDSASKKLIPSRVEKVGRVVAQGFYSPLTTTGRLFVDGVAVSSYALGSSGASVQWWESSALYKTNIETIHWMSQTFGVSLLYHLGLPIKLMPIGGWFVKAVGDAFNMWPWSW